MENILPNLDNRETERLYVQTGSRAMMVVYENVFIDNLKALLKMSLLVIMHLIGTLICICILVCELWTRSTSNNRK